MSEEDKEEKDEKKRRLVESDWKLVEGHIKQLLDDRKQSPFRKYHEEIWREVDRQVALKSMVRMNRDGSKSEGDWHNVFELGELAKASENISADVRRIIFPQARSWFECHSDVPRTFDVNTGRPVNNQALQDEVDGTLRAVMSQQHQDFGFKDRFDLSVKEALHHGSFVAEARKETMLMVWEGTKVKEITSPVWVPHSMWNCYPDPSPSIIGTNMFYNGSMIIESYTPRYKLKDMAKGDGWMPKRIKKVPKDEHQIKEQKTKDVKLTTFWGDIVIERSDEDIYFPNHKVVLANGVCVYFAPFDLPYPELIFRGYEKMDVRDPYYLSPIIMNSPMQKMTTILANRFVDSIDLDIERPLVYDGNDPDLVMNDGPDLTPGAKTPAKTSYKIQFLETGNPEVALQGLTLCLNYLKEHLSNPGSEIGDRATAAEVDKKDQDGETSIVGFIDKLESAVRSFLYMQHEINKSSMDSYSFYNPEMGMPDFLRISKDNLPKSVHFEVVGARGVLGERQRSQQASLVTAFAAKTPLFAPILKPFDLLKQMYLDAGVKHPEEFLKSPQDGIPPEVKAMIIQLQQQLRMVMAAYQKAKDGNDVKLFKIKQDHEAKLLKIAADLEKAIAKQEHEKHAHASGLVNDLIGMAHESNMQSQQHLHEKINADQPGEQVAHS